MKTTTPGKIVKEPLWHGPALRWITALFALSLCAMLAGGFLPIHDAIGWEGIHRFFSSGIREWQLPFWNKFSQGGTPFYPYYQSIGLIEPLSLGMTIMLKFLGVPIGYNYVITYLLLLVFTTFTSYLVIEHIVGNRTAAISFATIQFFVLLPVYIRQNGVVTPSLYMPCLTFLWLLFLESPAGPRKACLLVMSASVLGLACNLYLPSYIAFYFTGLAILSLAVNKEQRMDCFRFFSGRQGYAALFAAGCFFLCLAAPMLAQLWDMRHNTELIPTVRIFQKNGNMLADVYASDLIGGFFSSRLAVSTTLYTLLGIILEPIKLAGHGYEYYSEVSIYIGCIPLLCALYAVKNGKQPHIKIFSWMAVLLILISCSLGFRASPHLSAFQRLASFVFPLVRPVEIFQNFGAAATFCLIIVAAAGFREAIRNNDSAPFVLGLNILVVKSFILSFNIQKITSAIVHFGTIAAVSVLVVCILASTILFDRLIGFVNRKYFKSKPVYHLLYLLKYTLPILLTIAVTRNLLPVPGERLFLINLFCACLFLVPAYLEFKAVKSKAHAAGLPLFPGNNRNVLIAAVSATVAEVVLFNFTNLHNMGYILLTTHGILALACHACILGSLHYLIFKPEDDKKRRLYYFFLAGHLTLTSLCIYAYPLGQQTRLFGGIISRFGYIAGTITLLAACVSAVFALNALASLSDKYLTKERAVFSISPALYLLKLPAVFLLAIAFGSSIYPMLTAHRKPIFMFSALLLTALYLESWRIRERFRKVDFSQLKANWKIMALAVFLAIPAYNAFRHWQPRNDSASFFLGQQYFKWLADNDLVKDIPYKTVLYRLPYEDNYPAGFSSLWGRETFKKERTLYTYVLTKELAKAGICGHDKYRINRSPGGWGLYKNNFSSPLYTSISKPDFKEKFFSEKDAACFKTLMGTSQAYTPSWDSFYMTRYYYDFLVKVSLGRQLYAGGVINPVADFFPVSKTIITANKYEATTALNRLPDSSAGDTLVLESGGGAERLDAGMTDFFNPAKQRKFSPAEIEKYFDNLQLPRKPFPDFIKIVHDTGDRTVFRIDAPQDGFLYYADGYSKYWSAKLDGRPVEIHKANIAFKAVSVTKGQHTIEFDYAYGFLQAALYIFLTALCFFLLISARFFAKNRTCHTKAEEWKITG